MKSYNTRPCSHRRRGDSFGPHPIPRWGRHKRRWNRCQPHVTKSPNAREAATVEQHMFPSSSATPLSDMKDTGLVFVLLPAHVVTTFIQVLTMFTTVAFEVVVGTVTIVIFLSAHLLQRLLLEMFLSYLEKIAKGHDTRMWPLKPLGKIVSSMLDCHFTFVTCPNCGVKFDTGCGLSSHLWQCRTQ